MRILDIMGSLSLWSPELELLDPSTLNPYTKALSSMRPKPMPQKGLGAGQTKSRV